MDTVLYKLVDKQSRIYIVENTQMVLESNPFNEKTVSDVFRTALTFTCLLHGVMPNDRVTVKLETSDASAYLVFGADHHGDVQGYASEGFKDGRFDSFRSMLGEGGSLKIIRDNGYGAVFTGIVDIVGFDLEHSLSRYFMMSEQTRSVFRYFAEAHEKPACSRGVLVQALPFAGESFISQWSNRLEDGANALSDPETTIETLCETVFENAVVAETWTLRLGCSCSRQSVLDMLLRLDASDIEWTVTDTQIIEVRCGKCGRKYGFTSEEIASLIK